MKRFSTSLIREMQTKTTLKLAQIKMSANIFRGKAVAKQALG